MVTPTTEAGADSAWLIVGLGNPGVAYSRHRHNAGYFVVDELAGRWGGSLRTHKSRRADVLESRVPAPGAKHRVVLGRPRSYMNETGGAVATLLRFYRLPVERLIVVHDELDIDFPTLRVKLGGGDNGHNGLRSVRSAVGSGEFLRVRVGIGRPTTQQPVADFVLSPYSGAERAELPAQVSRAADAVVSLVTNGLSATQNSFNAGP